MQAPNRADGLTKVFKQFLGDIVYRDKEIQKSDEELALEHIPDAMVSYYQYMNTKQQYCKGFKLSKNHNHKKWKHK